MRSKQNDPSDSKGASKEHPAEPFFIVGIGASAGGLEALSALLGSARIDGAAYVVVQHLAPTQTSMLTELLGRATKLVVVTAEDGAVVKPNLVYVNPPNSELSILNGSLRIVAPPVVAKGVHLPIDSFLTSLAQDSGPHAVGVVLSGTGTDGTFGLAAIRAAGGISFVQDPETAKFDGMPRSALDSGAADFCLSPEAIAAEIFNLGEHPYLLRQQASVPQLEKHMGELSELIKTSFGIELADYKPNTIERRLQRRMAVQRIESVADYLRFCRKDPKELAALHRDLLINVTSFFRDGTPFEVLKDELLPRMLERKQDGDSVRIWVPACSSGEEAYSIAICLLELLDGSARNLKVQIFGTDVDAEAIQQARRGIYPPNIEATVSPDRLHRFFVTTDSGHYQVSRRVRDVIVFSTQNLCRDAPFSRLDLVSCRNVLIYLQPSMQQRVMRTLHYALLPDGYLMLGTSETVGDSADLFTLIDRKNKIYSGKHMPMLPGPDVDTERQRVKPSVAPATFGPPRRPVSLAQLADRKILDKYAPAAVVVSASLEVLYFRGRTTPYLEQPSGVATHGLLRLVRPELQPPLRKAIEQSLKTGDVTTISAPLKDDEGGFRPLTLVVQPLQEPETKAGCLLILFQEPRNVGDPALPRPSVGPPFEAEADEHMRQMAQELALTKDYLQSTIEEVERMNEDLKSANEELQSSNEELQSTNEELETSKEELQSTNEELITLNEELHNRMRDLSAANDDLHNVLLGVDRPMIIVGLDLRIRRFTRSAESLLNITAADVGQSVAQLDSFLGRVGIEKSVSDAITNISTVEQEVQAVDGRWYLLRVAPYKTLDLTIRGATIILIDIEVTKRRSDLVHAVDEYAVEFLAAVQHPLMIVNGGLSVIWVNGLYYSTFGVMRDETLGAPLTTVSSGRWTNAALEKAVRATLSAGKPFRYLKLDVDVPGQGRTSIKVGGSRIRGVADQTPLVLLSIEGEFMGRSREA